MEPTLNISHIQHFSVGDGPGIRTTVFFKGCSLRCPWCHNPETQSGAPEVLTYASTGQKEAYGRAMTVDTVESICREDHPFYTTSGGGVTISGGECLLDPKGTAALLGRLKAEDAPGGSLHTIVDTAGCVPYAHFAVVSPYTDIFFFDLKTADTQKYAAIGGRLDTVMENIYRLLSDGQTVRIRIPLIPGFNADEDSVKALTACILSLGAREVDLLPFHRLGSGKYTALGRTYAYKDTPPLPVEEAERLAAPLREAGLCVRVEQ